MFNRLLHVATYWASTRPMYASFDNIIPGKNFIPPSKLPKENDFSRKLM